MRVRRECENACLGWAAHMPASCSCSVTRDGSGGTQFGGGVVVVVVGAYIEMQGAIMWSTTLSGGDVQTHAHTPLQRPPPHHTCAQ